MGQEPNGETSGAVQGGKAIRRNWYRDGGLEI